MLALGACTGGDAGYCLPCFDAGLDAPARDARVNDATDALPDVAATSDTSMPAITWVSLPSLPAGCSLERAVDPEHIPPLAWQPCGDGCQRAPLGTTYWPIAGFYQSSRAWFVFISDRFGGGASQIMALAPIDGPPVAAWRYGAPTAETPYCRVNLIDVHEDWAAMVVDFIADDAALVIEDRIYAAPIDTIGSEDMPLAVLDAPDVGSGVRIDEIAVGTGVVVAGISGRVLVAHDASVSEALPRTATSGGYYVAAGADHAVFAETLTDWRLRDWTPDGGAAVYYDPPSDVGRPRVDGTTLTWIQYADFVGGSATRAELWTSSFARSGAALVPMLVHPNVEPNDAVLGDGTYGWYLPDAVHLVDVATTTERTLPLPSGVVCHPQRLYYVSRSDVLIGCVPPGETTLYAYRFDPRILAM